MEQAGRTLAGMDGEGASFVALDDLDLRQEGREGAGWLEFVVARGGGGLDEVCRPKLLEMVLDGPQGQVRDVRQLGDRVAVSIEDGLGDSHGGR